MKVVHTDVDKSERALFEKNNLWHVEDNHDALESEYTIDGITRFTIYATIENGLHQALEIIDYMTLVIKEAVNQ